MVFAGHVWVEKTRFTDSRILRFILQCTNQIFVFKKDLRFLCVDQTIEHNSTSRETTSHQRNQQQNVGKIMFKLNPKFE